MPSEVGSNFIVHFTSQKSHRMKHVSPLTIRCTLSGSERHTTSGGDYFTEPSQFLILNEGSECETFTDGCTESLSVFFEGKFAGEALRSMVTPDDRMLNHSYRPVNQPVTFFEKLYPHNRFISPHIMKMRIASRINYSDTDFMNENCYLLLENLVVLHRELYREISKLPPVKLSTKTELFRRICKAKDFIDSCFTGKLTLERIAAEACLSQFHFLRTFRIIFRQTPHQYILAKRFMKAFELLRHSDLPVTQICFEVGFESMSSFSWMFRKRFGLPPEVFRGKYRFCMRKLQ